MIVETTVPLKIGDQIPIAEFELGVSSFIQGIVSRKATEEEYIADCLADPACPEETKALMVVTGDTYRHWYEVICD